jgi:hypothetical protein
LVRPRKGALARPPAAIDAFRRFLARRGEAVDLAEPIETHIAVHVTEGIWLGVVRAKEIERLRSLNDQERNEPFIHWKYTRTARKVMRHMLEHQWEHLVELRERLGAPG